MMTLNLSFVLFFIAGLVHVGFFIIESYFFQKPRGYRYFKLSEADHKPAKIWALNQGFYNLFFALGTFVGVGTHSIQLLVFCALSMVAAGVVLWVTAPPLRRGALLQILPPWAALSVLLLSHY